MRSKSSQKTKSVLESVRGFQKVENGSHSARWYNGPERYPTGLRSSYAVSQPTPSVTAPQVNFDRLFSVDCRAFSGQPFGTMARSTRRGVSIDIRAIGCN